MRKRRPVPITVIAVVQVLPVILVPPALYRSGSPLLFAVPVALFVLVGWALFTLRPVGRMMTIFLQGFNIIVRVPITLARTVPSKVPGTPADVPLLVTSLLSIALSAVILYYVDQAEMQLLFEA